MFIFLLIVLLVITVDVASYFLLRRPSPFKDTSLPQIPQTDFLRGSTQLEIASLTLQCEKNAARMEELVAKLPGKVLESITNSANSHKGKLGELTAYIGIRASYDRIIPVADIVDFMCVSLPKEGRPGEVVFIEVKTGEGARLRKDQVAFRKLIQEKRVKFVELRIEANAPTTNEEDNNS